MTKSDDKHLAASLLPDGSRFIAAGYTLSNGAGRGDATPGITIFERS